ncbi:hypothetical protein SAMN05421630_103247 [Prauserella marina]|uniref:Uncharacterized protein n=1 Tax=Prauserella marina TaxID=530584 RepID=A0A1G6NQE7_9PSEU|nr:hypothetical protein [Prauserella marina]PWV82468.1 hypothetical protein DES30_102711 [Prauserella marina]SDC69901.1 hypothetical protein SAMN05421630_103247 [Prauserella marina]
MQSTTTRHEAEPATVDSVDRTDPADEAVAAELADDDEYAPTIVRGRE